MSRQLIHDRKNDRASAAAAIYKPFVSKYNTEQDTVLFITKLPLKDLCQLYLYVVTANIKK